MTRYNLTRELCIPLFLLLAAVLVEASSWSQELDKQLVVSATVLAQGGGSGLALSPNAVVYADPSKGIFLVPRSGGTATQLYQRRDPYELPAEVAVDRDSVYWTDHGLDRIMKYSFITKQTMMLTSSRRPLGIKLRGGVLYWASQGGSVNSMNVDGSNQQIYEISPSSRPAEIEVDDSAVYVTDLSGAIGFQKILRVDLRSKAVTVLASPEYLPGMITSRAGFVYWGAGGDNGGELRQVSKNGGKPFTIAWAPLGVMAIGLNKESIYFTTFARSSSKIDDEGFYRLDLQTGTQTRLAAHLSYPIQLIVDGNYVYLAEQARRIVAYRMSK